MVQVEKNTGVEKNAGVMKKSVIMYTKSTSSETKKIRMSSPRHQTIEAYRKLGMTLPPIAAERHAPSTVKSKRNSHHVKYNTTKQKPQTTMSLTVGRSLSDYVRKPVYFCHPVSFSTHQKNDLERDTLSSKSVDNSKKPQEEPTKNAVNDFFQVSQIKTKAKESVAGKDGTHQRKEASKSIDIPKKFLQFCESEGYDCTSTVFLRASISCKKRNKFSKVSKPSQLRTINECKVCLVEHAADKQRVEKSNKVYESGNPQPIERCKMSIQRSNIKETAQASAVKGQFAASKAITFILNDSGAPKKRTILPPLEKTSTHTFITTWNPDVSITRSQAT